MNRVTQYRIQAGWSPNELSSIFKVPAGIVNKWEHGELEPPAWIEERIRAKMMEEQKKRFSKKKRPSAKSAVEITVVPTATRIMV